MIVRSYQHCRYWVNEPELGDAAFTTYVPCASRLIELLEQRV